MNYFPTMSYLSNIRRQLAPELERMNRLISERLATRHEMINGVVENYLVTKGKQIRPIVVMLSAKMFGDVNDDVVFGCAALEMLHNASLIHDDVIDETKLRRGLATINSQWGNLLAVLIGDYFISNALSAGLLTGNLTIISALSDLGKELSVGEIDQALNVRSHSTEEAGYIDMIDKKTAALFVNCAKIGAEAVGASEEQYAPLLEYARLLGRCFQIKDDVFDYSADQERIGKPVGNDLKEGKVTLPLIYALRTAPRAEADKMNELLAKDYLSADEISALIEFARDHGGIEYAFQKMHEMQREAEKYLDHYPESEWKTRFREIFDFIISRDF